MSPSEFAAAFDRFSGAVSEECSSVCADVILRCSGVVLLSWLNTDIREERHWGVTGEVRLDFVRGSVRFGFMCWGSGGEGTTPWLCSVTHRFRFVS